MFCSDDNALSFYSHQHNSTHMKFRLQVTTTVGWAAIGFGTTMQQAEVYIAWLNSDGSVTLSRRESTGFALPSPVINQAYAAVFTNETGATSNGGFNVTFVRP